MTICTPMIFFSLNISYNTALLNEFVCYLGRKKSMSLVGFHHIGHMMCVLHVEQNLFLEDFL